MSVIATKINRFLTSEIPGDITVNSVRKAMLVNLFCVLGSVFPLIFIFVALSENNYAYSLLLVSLVFIFLSILVYLRITKNVNVASYILLSVNLLFFLYLIIGLSGNDATAPLWLYVFPPLALFLTNQRIGFVFTLILFVTVIICVNTMPHLYNTFSFFYKIRYFSTLTAVTLLCFVFEIIRGKTYILLNQTAETVLSQNDELLTQKEEIRQQYEEISAQRDNLSSINNELFSKNQHVTDSIEYAKVIQNAILPNESVFKNTFSDWFVMHEPKDIIGGDFFWMYKTCNKIYFAAADCTGHGVPGAFMSIVGYTVLNDIVRHHKIVSPALILSNLNTEIVEALNQKGDVVTTQDDGMDICICCIDTEAGEITVASANFYMFIYQQNKLISVESDIYSIGGTLSFRKIPEFREQKFNIEKGTTLYMFSDGFQDQLGSDGNKKFGMSRFHSLINKNACLSFAEQKEALASTLKTWRGNKSQTDDVLVVGLKM